jgi:hypothetical protein
MATHTRSKDSNSFVLVAVAAILLGLLVGVLGIVSVMMWSDARNNSKNETTPAASASSMPSMAMPGSSGGLTSYSGAAPENAAELAKAHAAYPAALPAVQPGPVANVNLVLKDVTIDIAPGGK